MADLSKVNINGTDYNFKDSTAIKGIQVNGKDLTIDSNKKVNIVNDYIMRQTTINCSGLDQNSWYPVTIVLSANHPTLIEINSNYSDVQVSWSTHNSKTLIPSHKIIKTIGSQYGVNSIFTDVYLSTNDWTNNIDPIQKMGQVSQVSVWYVYVRGGGLYYFKLSGNLVPTLHTTDYAVTNSSGSTTYTTLSVLTSNPNEPIKVSFAKGSFLPLAGGTMTGDITMNGNAIKVITGTTWQNSDRSIPFSDPSNMSRIRLYKDDFTYNPNTGALKAGSFVKKGGTSTQFLKADGSVDESVYLRTVKVVDNNATLGFGQSNVEVAKVDGNSITVNMPANPNTDTKVTSVGNHYTPTTNSASSLPTSMQTNTYVKQILRDAKGHVTGVNTEQFMFSNYGITAVVPNNWSMYTINNGTITVAGVKEFMQSIANDCKQRVTYNGFYNGFITALRMQSGGTPSRLTFQSSIDGRKTIISPAKPIYFTFQCDDIDNFLQDKSDAFCTIYAYVLDGTPLYNPIGRYIPILLWYTSGSGVGGYDVIDCGYYAEGSSTLSDITFVETIGETPDAIYKKWVEEKQTNATLQLNKLDDEKLTIPVEKFGCTTTKKATIYAPSEVANGNGTLQVTIYNTSIIMDTSYSVMKFTVYYDEKGQVMNVNIE